MNRGTKQLVPEGGCKVRLAGTEWHGEGDMGRDRWQDLTLLAALVSCAVE